ncbi:MAG: hypothetical protein IPK16_14020 [Anaerolineales bacterium]|nr:hypothetical protein [Anaerolineales bacterium]
MPKIPTPPTHLILPSYETRMRLWLTEHGIHMAPQEYVLWKAHFIRRLIDLQLDADTLDTLAQAVGKSPEAFAVAGGKLMNFHSWKNAAARGEWSWHGLGAEQRAVLVEAVAGRPS